MISVDLSGKELSDTKHRISYIEGQLLINDGEHEDNAQQCSSKQLQRQISGLQKRTSEIDIVIRTMTDKNSEIVAQVGNNNANITQRINNLELLVHSQEIHGNTAQNKTSKDAAPTAKALQQMKVSEKTGSIIEDKQKDTHAVDAVDTPDTEVTSGKRCTEETLLRTVCVDQNNQPQITITPSNKVEQDVTHDKMSVKGLRGFIPPAKRQQYKVFFVSGIYRDDENIDDSINKVKAHMEFNSCNVKSIRHVKHSSRTVSVKVVVTEESEALMMSASFWPEGIQCRPWID